MKPRMTTVLSVAGVFLFAGSVFGFARADAEVSPHCPQDGFCLFSGADFAGSKAGVPAGLGCRTMASLGIANARSAARGFGDGYALELFSDNNCTTSVGVVYHEIPDTVAKSYRLIPLPGRVGQLSSVGAAWEARLRRIKRIAEAIQHSEDQRGLPR